MQQLITEGNRYIVSHHVIPFLSIRDVYSLCQTSKYFDELINSRGSDYSEWIWHQICECEFNYNKSEDEIKIPLWCKEGEKDGEEQIPIEKHGDDQVDTLQIQDWKKHCKALIKVFDLEGTRHQIKEKSLDFNMRETLWSNRELYDFSHSNFKVSFEFYFETGDSEMRIAFSENKKEDNCLVFRISGEADMTGTHLKNTTEEDFVYYAESTVVTFGVWNRIEFNFVSDSSLDVIINGESLSGIMPVLISKKGFIGFVKSNYRFDKLFIRNFRGSFTERPLTTQTN